MLDKNLVEDLAYGTGISLNTLTGEDAMEILRDNYWDTDLSDEEAESFIEEIQKHLWTQDEEGEWSNAYDENNNPSRGIIVLEFDPDEFGYAAVGTDAPYLFDYFEE